jgi:hypothetical protein
VLWYTLAAEAPLGAAAAVGVDPDTVTSRTTVFELLWLTATYEAMPTATAARTAALMAKIRVICSFPLYSIPSEEDRTHLSGL